MTQVRAITLIRVTTAQVTTVQTKMAPAMTLRAATDLTKAITAAIRVTMMAMSYRTKITTVQTSLATMVRTTNRRTIKTEAMITMQLLSLQSLRL